MTTVQENEEVKIDVGVDDADWFGPIVYDDEEAKKRAIELMRSNWRSLNEKYGWMEGGCCTKFFHKLWFFFSGLFCLSLLLFILLAIELPLILILFVFYFICCKPCRCQSFLAHVRLFYGKQRLCLCSVALEKQGCCWWIWDRIIGLLQILEFLVFAAQIPGLFNHYKIYRGLFGDQFPYLFSVGITNYERVKEQIICPNAMRSGNFVGFWQGPTNDAVKYLHQHALSTLDFRHVFARRIAMILNWSQIDFNTVELPDGFLKAEFKDLETAVGSTGKIHYATLFYLWFGVRLTQEEIDGMSGVLLSAGLMTFPPWMHFLLLNDLLLRNLYSNILYIKTLVRKYGGIKVGMVERLCEEYGMEKDIGYNCLAVTVLFAGGVAQQQMMGKQYGVDVENQRNAFNSNPMNYCLEYTRWQSSLPVVVANQSQEVMNFEILGKVYAFPKSTLIGSALGAVDQDTPPWENGNDFSVNRDYGAMMTFNCVQSYFDDGNEAELKTAPRFCPGHKVAIYYLKMIALRMHQLN